MAYRIIFSPEARDDLGRLFTYISRASSPDVALGYIERIEAYCLGFTDFPKRGQQRHDLRPGLRIVGFEGRVTIAFHIDGDLVIFDRILYGGRSLGQLADGD